MSLTESSDCLPVLLAALSAPAALADEAKQVFDSLYAQKIRQVTATADRADDIALAKEILAIARESGSTPKLQILLAEATADLAGRHPDGYATAIEALQLVADEHETQREAARAKMVDLLTRQSRTGTAEARAAAGDSLIDLLINMGDEKAEKKQYAEAAADYRRANTLAVQRKSDQVESIKAKLEFAMSRDRAVKQIARLQEKLLQNANDHATAEEIVKLYVVELDEPKEAKRYVERSKNKQLELLVASACTAIGDTTPDECLMLGDWYKSLADSATGSTRIRILQLAQQYLTRYLTIQTDDDLKRLKASTMLKQIEVILANAVVIPRVTSPAARPINVLRLIDVSKDAHRADWQSKNNGAVQCEKSAGSASLILPVMPNGDYQLRLSFTRVDGVDAVIIILPVGKSQIALMFDGANEFRNISGLDHLNGRDRHINVTTSRIQMKNGTKFTATATVKVADDEATIEVTFEGKPLFQWVQRKRLRSRSMRRLPGMRIRGCIVRGAFDLLQGNVDG